MSDTESENSSEHDVEVAAASLLIMGTSLLITQSNTLMEKRRRRKTRKWLQRREENKGLLSMLNNELLKEDSYSYHNFLRMDRQNFNKLLMSIENLIAKKDTLMCDAIPARNR